MANKGANRHMKRIAAPKYQKIMRRLSKYVVKPGAGKHRVEESIALLTVLKEKLNLARNSAEARRILNRGLVEVDGKVIKEEKYPIGFGDIIHLKPTDDYYRVGMGKYNTFTLDKISKEESSKNMYKVVGKYIAKGNKAMLRLHNGNAIKMEKDAKVGDSVIIENGKIEEVLKFKEGAKCLVINGVHASAQGVIKSITPSSSRREKIVEVEGDGSSFQTTANNIMVVGA